MVFLMTYEKYIKRLRKLARELAKAGTAEPYDPDAYNAVIKKINDFNNRARLRSDFSPAFVHFAVVFVILFYLWLLWLALSEAFEWGI